MTVQRDTDIRTYPLPNCYLCGVQGLTLYSSLKDRLFLSPGEWNLKHCPNPGCGLMWLDPMPSKEDIGKAYAAYYTSQNNNANEQGNRLRIFLILNLRRLYKLLLRATTLHRERRRRTLMYLDEMTPGRLLDVGCGNGSWCVYMRARGWDVTGQEIDPKAVASAPAHLSQVHLGTLGSAAFPTDSFDAVVMNHVLEHVHEPVALLAECYRIARPGGLLIVTTPNSESYGHKHFGACWRGLEPPRHLHLFSVGSLKACAMKAGFRVVEIFTTSFNAAGIYLESRYIQMSGKQKMELINESLYRSVQAGVFMLKEYFLSVPIGDG